MRDRRRERGEEVVYRSIYRNRKRSIRLIIVLPPPHPWSLPTLFNLSKALKSFQRWNLLDGWSFPIVLLHFYPRRDINFILPFQKKKKKEKKGKSGSQKLNFIRATYGEYILFIILFTTTLRFLVEGNERRKIMHSIYICTYTEIGTS